MGVPRPDRPVPGPIGRKDGRWYVGDVGRKQGSPWVQGITAPSGRHYVLVRISDGGVTVYSHGIGCYFSADGTMDPTRNSKSGSLPSAEALPEYVAVFEHHTLPASTRGSEG